MGFGKRSSTSPVQDGARLQTSPAFPPWDSESGSSRQGWRARLNSIQVAPWSAPVAFALAIIGEYMLFTLGGRVSGMVLLVAATLLGVAALASARPAADFVARAGKERRAWLHITWTRILALRLAGILASVCLSAGSILAYMRDPLAIFGLQGSLWVGGMALLLLSCALWYPRLEAANVIEEVATNEATGAVQATPTWTRSEIFVFAGLIALSLVTHLAFLDQIPWRMHFDEGYAYTEVMRYYRGPAIPLFTTTWAGTSLPSLWFGLESLLMHITGPNLAGVRLGVALAGALTVVPVYGLGRLLAGRMGAMLAAFAVGVSAADVHYSRVSIINMTTALAWAVCFYFLLNGMRSRRPGDFVWAGLAAGLSMYTYYGTRLLPFLLVIFVAYLLIFHYRGARERLGHFALVAIGFVAGFGPLIGYFMLNPQMWAGRGISQLVITSGIPTTWGALGGDARLIAALLWREFLGLGVIPGRDTVYFAPFLLPFEAALVVLGGGILVWRWRQPASFLVLLWILGVVFTGGLLIEAPTIPNFAHWTPAFPAFYLALALPLALWCSSIMKLPRRSLRIAIPALVGLLMALDLGANAYAYLVQYPPLVPDLNSLEGSQGRYMESIPANTHVRSISNLLLWSPLYAPVDEMMASPGSSLSKFVNPSRELPMVQEPGHNLAFLLYSDMLDYLPVVQSYYPGGTMGEIRIPNGDLIADTYFVPSSATASRYGVLATFAPINMGGASEWSGQVATVGALPSGVQLSYPLAATWTGAFYLGAVVPVELHVQGADNASLWVQGGPVLPDTPLDLQPGWVHFSVSARLDKAGPIKLMLQQGNTPAAEIDNAHLWPMPLDQGLAVTVNGPSSGPTHRIDSFLGAALPQPAPFNNIIMDPEALPLFAAGSGSTQIRWEGELNTAGGPYTVEIRSDARIQLSIDGRSVINMCATQQSTRIGYGQIELKAGWHHVQIDYQVGGVNNGMEWFWARPDGVSEVVPPSALRIAPQVSDTTTINWPVLPAPVPCQ